MNDFSLTRIPNHNLFGLLFPPLVDISEYQIEIVYPEYQKGKYIPDSGTITTSSVRQCAIMDVSKYDYILLPIECASDIALTSGLRDNASSGAIGTDYFIKGRCSNVLVAGYMIFPVIAPKIYACINATIDHDFPVIGFKHTRSDLVNPKSPSKEPEVKEAIEEPVEKTVKRSTKK